MKIAQICPRYSPDIGGVETHVKEISERFVKRGHDVEVITTNRREYFKKFDTINGVKVTRFRSFSPGDAYYLAPQIYSYLRSQNYDIIHAHSYHALPALFAVLAKHKSKFIFTPHYHRSGHTFFRNLLHKPYRLFGKIIFSRADCIICVSEYEKKLIAEDFNVNEKIKKIPNGINFSEFEGLRPKQIENHDKTLLYVGRLEEYKGVQYIIQILPELPKFRLKIVGKGPYENELQRFASELKVSDRIEWLKNISRLELLQCYAQADVFVMLSQHEAYGITVAEALASGTPCLVAKGSALDEFVDGKMCIGVEIPIKIKKIINSIGTLKDMKLNGFPNLKNLQIYDWNHITDQILSTYINK